MYDPMGTLHWMLDNARAELASDVVAGDGGRDARPRRKTKAQRAAEEARFAVLCEVLWNIAGRPVPLVDFVAERREGYARAA